MFVRSLAADAELLAQIRDRETRAARQHHESNNLFYLGYLVPWHSARKCNLSSRTKCHLSSRIVPFVEKVATFFGVGFDDLLGNNDKPQRKPGPTPQIAQLTERLSRLPRAQQKIVVKMLEGVLQKTG
jgi:hypothetical protein